MAGGLSPAERDEVWLYERCAESGIGIPSIAAVDEFLERVAIKADGDEARAVIGRKEAFEEYRESRRA